MGFTRDIRKSHHIRPRWNVFRKHLQNNSKVYIFPFPSKMFLWKRSTLFTKLYLPSLLKTVSRVVFLFVTWLLILNILSWYFPFYYFFLLILNSLFLLLVFLLCSFTSLPSIFESSSYYFLSCSPKFSICIQMRL